MRDSIILCGVGDDGDMAAIWAEDRAREARLSSRAVKMYGERVRTAYEQACTALLCASGEKPVMKISLDQDVLTPRFDMVDTAAPSARMSPRAIRALKLREAVVARRAKRAAEASA